MRRPLTLLYVCLAVSGRALGQADIVFDAANTVVTGPMTLVDGVLHQFDRTELPQSGTAVVTINVPVTGEYILHGLVDAPAADADSFFLDFDQPPAGPAAIWDIPAWVGGFGWRPVTRRGTGNTDAPEFDPMVFTLSAGEHRLFIAGRERAKLRSLRLVPFSRPLPGSVEALQQAYTGTEKQLGRDLRMLTTAERNGPKQQVLTERWGAENDAHFAAALKIAGENLGQSAGLVALDWIVHAPVSHYREAGPEAAIMLRQHYAADPAVGRSVAFLAHHSYPRSAAAIVPEAFRLFETVARDNPDRTARGQAVFGLAMSAKADALLTPPTGEQSEIATRKAIKLMETVRRDYGDLPYLKSGRAGQTLGQQADSHLIELRALRLGAPAPEIAGQDLDGAPLKLSDYRGKVVVLVFWAAWCGPCIQNIPKEKKMVERFKGRPFALIGVNGDSTLAEANQAVKQHTIPWRSFWDRQDRYITKAWNIVGWPTIYVIDHEGFIQQRLFLDEDELEPLVAAAEKKP
jgi:peroxiredoxin